MSDYPSPYPSQPDDVPDIYSTIRAPYQGEAQQLGEDQSPIPLPPAPPIELLSAPIPYSMQHLSWWHRHPLLATLIATLLIAQLVADFAGIISIHSMQTQLSTIHQQLETNHNLAGQTPANPTPASTAHQRVIDNLNDWSKTYTYSSDLSFDDSDGQHFNGDTSLAYRQSSLHDEVVWKLPNISTFSALTYFWQSEPNSPFTLYTSSDSLKWTMTTPTISTGPTGTADWQGYLYTLDHLSGINYVKMYWNNISGKSWSPEISQVTLSS